MTPVREHLSAPSRVPTPEPALDLQSAAAFVAELHPWAGPLADRDELPASLDDRVVYPDEWARMSRWSRLCLLTGERAPWADYPNRWKAWLERDQLASPDCSPAVWQAAVTEALRGTGVSVGAVCEVCQGAIDRLYTPRECIDAVRLAVLKLRRATRERTIDMPQRYLLKVLKTELKEES